MLRSRIGAFAIGIVAFSLFFLAVDYVVMDMQGLSLMFEHQE